MTDQEMFDELCEPFAVELVDWRVGPTNARSNGGVATKGQALAYIDARAVMDRFDSACGFARWQCNYDQITSKTVVCNIGVRTHSGEWVWKSDGAGETDMEAEKGALSDAFKRAAVRFGVGRYLYEIEAPWIELEGGKFIPKDARKRLDDLHEKAASKYGWGDRPGVNAYRVLLQTINNFITQPSDVASFREANKGMIELLPVKMRKNLEMHLARIGA